MIWGRYEPSFDLSEPEAYRRDAPNARVHLLDAGHFALDTMADEIAVLIGDFVGSSWTCTNDERKSFPSPTV